MKVVIDSAIPYIRGIIEPYAEVRYMAGAEFTRDAIADADADALIIRTRTIVDAKLLENTRVSYGNYRMRPHRPRLLPASRHQSMLRTRM